MNAQENYEQLKRRNRRRLVGALIMVVIAAILLVIMLSRRTPQSVPAPQLEVRTASSETASGTAGMVSQASVAQAQSASVCTCCLLFFSTIFLSEDGLIPAESVSFGRRSDGTGVFTGVLFILAGKTGLGCIVSSRITGLDILFSCLCSDAADALPEPTVVFTADDLAG